MVLQPIGPRMRGPVQEPSRPDAVRIVGLSGTLALNAMLFTCSRFVGPPLAGVGARLDAEHIDDIDSVGSARAGEPPVDLLDADAAPASLGDLREF